MSCGNGNCSCGDDCKCGSGCKTGLEFFENTTTFKIVISGVAPLKMYCDEAELNFGEVTASLEAGSNYSCDSFAFHN